MVRLDGIGAVHGSVLELSGQTSSTARGSTSPVELSTLGPIHYTNSSANRGSDGSAHPGLPDRLSLLADAVEQGERALGRIVLPVSAHPRFITSGTMELRGETIQLSQTGLRTLAQRAKAPSDYVAHLPADLRAELLEYHAEDGAFDDTAFFVRDGELVGLGPTDLVWLHGREVVEAVAEAADGQPLHVTSLDLRPDGFEVGLVATEKRAEVVPGDVIEAGLWIRHSFFGAFATTIEAFLLRLVCSNGLVRRECPGRRAWSTRKIPVSHPDPHGRLRAQVVRLAEHELEGLRDKLAEVSRLTQEPADPVPVLRRWLAQFRLPRRALWPLIERALREEPLGNSLYAALNALTRVANYRELSASARRRVQQVAGLVAFARLHLCERCRSVLAAW